MSKADELRDPDLRTSYLEQPEARRYLESDPKPQAHRNRG